MTSPSPILSVLLRHSLPGGTAHLDWMIAREPSPPPDERCLITFRLALEDDPMLIGSCEAIRLPDHRARYLEYEGPISGDRGRVERVWSSEVLSLREDQDGLAVHLLGRDGPRSGCRFEVSRCGDTEVESDPWAIRRLRRP